MKRILLAPQVVGFLRQLPPVPKARVKRGLRSLARGAGDIKALAPPLDGYCRLRVGGYRVVFAYHGAAIECIFAEQRSVVYELVLAALRDEIEGR